MNNKNQLLKELAAKIAPHELNSACAFLKDKHAFNHVDLLTIRLLKAGEAVEEKMTANPNGRSSR